jgi:beta-lactam-binding protein with PASTA domain
MSVQDAKARLLAAGFVPVVAKRRVFVDYARAKTVAYTSPGSGASAYLGQTVTVYVSAGRRSQPGHGGPSPQPTASCPPFCQGQQ